MMIHILLASICALIGFLYITGTLKGDSASVLGLTACFFNAGICAGIGIGIAIKRKADRD